MKISDVCENYFSGFQEIRNFEKNNKTTNALAFLKIFSYFTGLIPLGFAAVYGGASLYGRIKENQELSTQDTSIHYKAIKTIQQVDDSHFNNNTFAVNKAVLEKVQIPQKQPILLTEKKELPTSQDSAKVPDLQNISTNPIIMQTLESKEFRAYPGDLRKAEKANIETKFKDSDATLQIVFKKKLDMNVPGQKQENFDFNVSIRRQDMFKSGAEVIVNAANEHLGGGGGIDGAIHQMGGEEYAAEHRELKKKYKANYVLGHAAMIGSGLLKNTCKIDNVIVVAGPRGESSALKESQLYSCCYNSLLLAQSQGKTSIAFPSISTGEFKFPKDRAASIMLRAINDFINNNPDSITRNISIHFLPSESRTFLESYQKAAE